MGNSWMGPGSVKRLAAAVSSSNDPDDLGSVVLTANPNSGVAGVPLTQTPATTAPAAALTVSAVMPGYGPTITLSTPSLMAEEEIGPDLVVE